MSNPTTPFSWQMPTATDLVTDLPADFAVFGQAVATSMADLLGGTTGQVLSKTTNADMDFTWVTTDDTNAIQNAIVDAKGDLIGATAADTPARLAVGANGTVLTADSTAATGLAWAAVSTPAYVGCSLYKSADQSLSNVTTTVVTWDSEHYDTNAFHSTVTNNSRITIPANYGGKYLIQVTLNWNSNSTSYREARIRLNGSTLLAYSPIQAASSGGVANTLNVVKILAAADYIEIQGEQASGGALSISGGNTYSAQVQVTYLGA
jgi:hypothetical protein